MNEFQKERHRSKFGNKYHQKLAQPFSSLPDGGQTDRTGASSATSFVSCKEEVEEQRKEQSEVGEEEKSGLKVPSIRPDAAPNFAAFREWLDFVDKVSLISVHLLAIFLDASLRPAKVNSPCTKVGS